MSCGYILYLCEVLEVHDRTGLLSLLLLDVPIWAIQLQKLLITVRKYTVQSLGVA